MKIVQCFFTMEIGGSQTLAIDLMNEMCLTNQVELIIVNDQWSDEILKNLNKNVLVHYINRPEGSKNPFYLLKFNYLLYKLKPDIIHCHENKLIKLIKYYKSKTVYTAHDTGLPVNLLDKYDSVVAISESVAKDIYQRAGLNLSVVQNGVPISIIKKRNSYLIKQFETIKLIQISRLVHEKKGQDILIKAFSKLINEYKFENISLDFIGSGKSYDYLVDLAKSLNLDSKINFLNNKDRNWVFSNLLNYHILIQPSRYEGFGLTVVEGIAAGLPVLASDIEGPSEIVNSLACGFLFETENVESCANGLKNIIERYHKQQIESTITSSEFKLNEKYSITSTVKGYIEVYNKLLTS